MRVQIEKLLNAVDISTNVTSKSHDLNQEEYCAVQATYTGTPSGNFIIEASNDNANWAVVSTTAISVVGSTMINLPDIGYYYVRVRHAFTSGAGTLTVVLVAKGN